MYTDEVVILLINAFLDIVSPQLTSQAVLLQGSTASVLRTSPKELATKVKE